MPPIAYRTPWETGPACPRCQHLSEWGGVYCAECGARLALPPATNYSRADGRGRGTLSNLDGAGRKHAC